MLFYLKAEIHLVTCLINFLAPFARLIFLVILTSEDLLLLTTVDLNLSISIFSG